MVKHYEAKHFFMAIGICVLIVTPVLLVFMPAFIANSIYLTPGTWIVIVPAKSYIIYAVGSFVIGASSLLLYFGKLRKTVVIIGIILFISGIILLLLGARPHIAIGDKGIAYNNSLSAHINQYSWQDVEEINYYDIDRSEGFDQYEIFFTDGNKVLLSENGFLMRYHKALFDKFSEENITIHWK
ncbi:hypothetical protein [Paucisalibacillus globulus]|uniref:hypothetical protein n=1 Tax=Paucisalibacillus globulus TaxID=351095 RepID=UPI000BB997C3|nr:hypothetical protein [Paucisalibacillus globulus]